MNRELKVSSFSQVKKLKKIGLSQQLPARHGAVNPLKGASCDFFSLTAVTDENPGSHSLVCCSEGKCDWVAFLSLAWECNAKPRMIKDFQWKQDAYMNRQRP